MEVEKRIIELGYKLPKICPPKAMYIPVKEINNLLFVSGQIPMIDNKIIYKGKVGDKISLEQAKEASKICVLNGLASLKDYLGDLDKIKNIIKLQVFVNSKVGFVDQHLVANGASGLLYEVFGEKGRHTRTAIGTNQLPLDISVEVEMIISI